MTTLMITKAAQWHVGQRRKGETSEPYINHLLEVAALVAEAEPTNTDLIVAALLHDAIEDQPIDREMIVAEFGERVAGLVEEATDDKSLPKEDRKQLQIETAAKKTRNGKMLKLADKISNLRSIATSPPSHWPLDRRQAYIDWSVAVASAGLIGQSQLLDALFDDARRLAEQSVLEAARLQPAS
jgi:guanosine-3',5'-bis(diphosphate) 3'-pyrophosphohydrolase